MTTPVRRRPRDPLLAAVRIGSSIGMAIAVIVAAASLVSIPLALWRRDFILAEIAKRTGAATQPDFIWVVCGIAALSIVAAVLGFLFLREMRRIIDTVALGDPFTPINADRLLRMAWLSVGIHLVALPADFLSGWARHLAKSPEVFFGFSLGGVFLTLVLFVLARVFRKGAEMRDELEGTV